MNTIEKNYEECKKLLDWGSMYDCDLSLSRPKNLSGCFLTLQIIYYHQPFDKLVFTQSAFTNKFYPVYMDN